MIKLYQLQDDRLTRILLTTADRIFGIKRPVACLAISAILTIMLFLTTFPAERGNILLIFSCLVVVLFSVIAIGNIKTLPAVKNSIVRNKGEIIEITFDKANKLAICGWVFCPEMTISQFWLEDYYIIFF